jgi:hypothetical protein
MKKYPSLVPFCNKYPLQRDIFCLEKLRFMYGPLGPVWSFAPYEALLLGWLKLGFGFGEKGNWLALGFWAPWAFGCSSICFATLAQLSLHSMLRKLALLIVS